MKKLGVILTAAAVLFWFGASAFAMDIYEPEMRAAKMADEKASVLIVSGEIDFGMMTSFTYGEGSANFYNLYMDFTMWPDEINSAFVELAATGINLSSGTLAGRDLSASNFLSPEITYAYITTRLGDYFGLPVGLETEIGKTSLYSNKYEVTAHAYERTPIRTWIDPVPFKVTVDADVVTATVAFGFGQNNGATTFVDGEQNDFGVYFFIPVDPVEVEVFYMAQDNPDLKGRLGFDAKATGLMNGMLGFAGGFAYDVAAAGTALDPSWFWGFGAEVIYAPAELGVSVNGMEETTVNQLGVDLKVSATDYFGIFFGLGLLLADGAPSTFNGLEGSVWIDTGAAAWYVGYVYADADNSAAGVGYGGVNTGLQTQYGPEGGFFISSNIDF
jgi:hypothetical protein